MTECKNTILFCPNPVFASLIHTDQSPSLSSLLPLEPFKHEKRSSRGEVGGGAQFWERGTFLNNGFTAGSQQVHRLNLTEESCAPVTAFLSAFVSSLPLGPRLSLFWGTSFCFSSVPQCIRALASVFVRHSTFLTPFGFFHRGYLH